VRNVLPVNNFATGSLVLLTFLLPWVFSPLGAKFNIILLVSLLIGMSEVILNFIPKKERRE
jgi:hypothetical protein